MKLSPALLLSLILPIAVIGQKNPVRFQHITAKEGLSQGHVLCMIQDSKGYVWAGTYNGLNRYNGYNFDTFYADDSDSASLIINVVFSLFEDSKGKIWCGTWGVDIYDPLTESFRHIPAEQGPNSISAGEVSRILEDQQGKMWFATQGGGLNTYDPETGTIVIFNKNDSLENSLQSDRVNDIVLDEHQTLWIATEDGGLSRMNLPDKRLKTYRHSEKDPHTIASDGISCLYIDTQQNLWLGHSNGSLSKYNREKDNFQNFRCCPEKLKINNARIFEIVEDWNGDLLLATNGAGLIWYHPEKDKADIFLHNGDDNESIISNENSSLLIDRTNTLFVGSYGRGISKYSPFSSKFDVYKVPVEKFPSSDINAFTDAMEDSQGNLVVGTYHGFLVYDQKSWEYRHYLPGNSYEANKVLTMETAPDGSVWISTMRGLHRYDRDYTKIRTYYPGSDLKDQSIYSIEFDHKGNLWIGQFIKGLLRVDESVWRDRSRTSLEYTPYYVDYSDTTTVPGNQQWIIQLDADSNLWVGGVGGLARYNYETDNFTRVFTQGTVKTFDRDKQGNLWIGTIGTGLFCVNPETGETKKYTTREGLSHSFIYGVLSDSEDNIWVSSEGGLSRFSIPREEFRNFDLRDGLPNDHFDDKAESKLSGGRIYMGTNNGFVIFKPENIQDDTSASKVVLSGLRIDNKPIEFYRFKPSDVQQPVRQLSKITLNPSQRDIEIRFAALHFAAPHKIHYKYQLEGYDKQWIYTDASQRTAKYTNLNGGQYIFRVYATNSDGYWSKEPLELKITVVPPFYKTSYFRFIILFLSALVIYLVFRWRLAEETRQKRKLELTVAERTREISQKNQQLQQIAHDLEESNAQLKEQQQQVEEQSEELEAQRDELSHLNATKDKLLSVIAHDLKNPFNALLGYVELLLMNYDRWQDEKKIHFLRLLKETSENAYRLLENLLQWSRSQSGVLKFDPSNMESEEIIQATLPEVKSQAEKKDVKIIVKTDSPDPVRVWADPNMISVILRNLLSNAIKFSKKGGEVNITVSRHDGHYACFEIRDQGIGMPAENLNDLFTFESNKTTIGTEGEKGTGLGLILCHEYIEHHTVKIWCESTPNKGSSLFFTIPLVLN